MFSIFKKMNNKGKQHMYTFLLSLLSIFPNLLSLSLSLSRLAKLAENPPGLGVAVLGDGDGCPAVRAARAYPDAEVVVGHHLGRISQKLDVLTMVGFWLFVFSRWCFRSDVLTTVGGQWWFFSSLCYLSNWCKVKLFVIIFKNWKETVSLCIK